MEDKTEILAHLPLFAKLDPRSLEAVATLAKIASMSAGTVLMEQGEPARAFYVIVTGEAEVIGDGALVRTVGPGGSFGEIALVQDVPRTATIRAHTDLDVYELARDDFLDAIGGYSPSSDAAYAVVARHLANFSPVGLI